MDGHKITVTFSHEGSLLLDGELLQNVMSYIAEKPISQVTVRSS